jgi:uncharacterized protein YoxC
MRDVMDQQLPTALQAALYAGSAAIIALVAVLTVLLLQFRRQVERVVQAVEELKAEVSPLVQETRGVVEQVRDLSWRVQGQWMEVERIVGTARSWSQRVNRLVAGVGSVMELRILAASFNLRALGKGLETFVRALSNRE